ncbi:MAG TPA: molybdopterin molybdenumtransferase MoeA, partial [Gammaproteobacteria bacterium]|nr:molybdopterin molybdenumtransferase MoeA [Gammaproteobacteria bacterium]
MNDTTHDPCATPKGLLSVDEARNRIAALITPISGTEQLPIRNALGRILAASVISTINVPPYTNSAMDGYALRGSDLPASGEARLRVIGRAMAGAPFGGQLNAGETVRIMTGAAMPDGADTVLMQEVVQVDGECIIVKTGHKPGENVRQAGEDMA